MKKIKEKLGVGVKDILETLMILVLLIGIGTASMIGTAMFVPNLSEEMLDVAFWGGIVAVLIIAYAVICFMGMFKNVPIQGVSLGVCLGNLAYILVLVARAHLGTGNSAIAYVVAGIIALVDLVGFAWGGIVE